MRDSNPSEEEKELVCSWLSSFFCVPFGEILECSSCILQPSWTPKTVRLVGTLNISFLTGNISSVDKELYGEYPVPPEKRRHARW